MKKVRLIVFNRTIYKFIIYNFNAIEFDARKALLLTPFPQSPCLLSNARPCQKARQAGGDGDLIKSNFAEPQRQVSLLRTKPRHCGNSKAGALRER